MKFPQYRFLIGIFLIFSSLLLSESVFAASGDVTRSQFISTLLEVNCDSCKIVNAIDAWKFEKPRFADVGLSNPDYYCIEKAISKWYVEGYDSATLCQDGTNASGSKFCPNNTITRIEASAVLLRQALIWNDVYDKADTTPYGTINWLDVSWNRYARKAIEAWLVSGDINTIKWNDPISQSEWDTMLTKFDAIKMCVNPFSNPNSFGLDIGVASSSTAGGVTSYNLSSILDGRDADEVTYEWIITKRSSGTWDIVTTYSGPNLSTITLQPNESYGVHLRVRDVAGVQSEAFVSLSNNKNQVLEPNISTLYGGNPTVVSGSIAGNTDLIWNDNGISSTTWVRWSSSYTTPWSHQISIIDKIGDTVMTRMSTVGIIANTDLDNDGIPNANDLCPSIRGTLANGCPAVVLYGEKTPTWVYVETINQDTEEVAINYTGDSQAEVNYGDGSDPVIIWPGRSFHIFQGDLGNYNVSLRLLGGRNAGSFLYLNVWFDGNGSLYGGKVRWLYDGASACEKTAISRYGSIDIVVACNQCPCPQTINSLMDVKACDTLYPAFLSNDKSTLFSQGPGGDVSFDFWF
jgi:hypothetical protein